MARFVELGGSVDVFQAEASRVERAEGFAFQIARAHGGGEAMRGELLPLQAKLERRQARRSINRTHRDEAAGSVSWNDGLVLFRERPTKASQEALRHEGTIPPHGTSFISLEAVWPQISEFIGSVPVGVAVIESRADLAIVQISRHQRSGVCAVEHFMAVPTFHHGKRYLPAGA